MYAVVVVAVDFQRAGAAEQQLALCVEGSLVVVLRRGAVGHLVLSVQHDEGALLAEQVDGGRVGVGDVGAAQLHFILLVAQNGQRAVRRGAADDVADALRRAVVGLHVTAVDGDGDAVLRLGLRVGHVDGHLRLKAVLADVVLFLGVVGRGCLCGLGRGAVNVHLEGQQLAAAAGGAAGSAAGGAACRTAGTVGGGDVTVVVVQWVVRRASRRSDHQCCKHAKHCHLFHILCRFLC